MTQYLVTKDKLDALAVSVSDKSGEELPLTIDEMREAVNGIGSASGNLNITRSGVTDVTNYATVTVPEAAPYIGFHTPQFYTESNRRKWRIRPMCDFPDGEGYGWMGGAVDGDYIVRYAVPANTTITPTASSQMVGGANYMMEGPVTVAAMPAGQMSMYTNLLLHSESVDVGVDSSGLVSVSIDDYGTLDDSPVYQSGYFDTSAEVGVYTRGSSSLQLSTQAATTITPSTTSQTAVAAGKYTTGAVTVAAMPSGTAGTPTATKGTVSNHTVSVTPSVTNTAGYITGGTKTGTAVTVQASELVSGNLAITDNGTGIDVTNYATVSVDVSGGGSDDVQLASRNVTSATASSISFSQLNGEPTSFFVMAGLDIATSSTPKVAAIAYDGTNLHGQTITNTSNAQVSYDGSGFTKTYSNGTLTITSSGTAAFLTDSDAYVVVYSYKGTAGNIQTADVQVGSGAASITFTGLEDEPLYWSCIFKSNFSTSSGYQRVIATSEYSGSILGLEMDSSAHVAQHWTSSYSNGSLTITSNGTNAGGYFHQPGYYQLTYAIGGDQTLQTKTVTPTTSTQNVTADTAQGYTALKKVVVDPIPSQYVVPTGNIAITSNTATGQSLDVSQYATATVNVPTGGSSWAIDTKTTTASNRPTSLSFTSMKGQPHAFFLRCTSSMSRSSNSSYYYVADMRYNGTNTTGNCWRMSNGNWTNITSGYSYTYSGTTLTVSSSGTTTSSPGCFYNGSYELVYVY